ncbi:ABC transporter ATP-binding protein [Latilactobacillus curvatus]|nr:ABC transporter ATP-binding protein [Latilactobacillus curvatus]
MVNTILKEADLFCPNSVRINFTIYLVLTDLSNYQRSFINSKQLQSSRK